MTTAATDYRYDHIKAEMFKEHSHFEPGSLGIGQRIGDGELYDPTGACVAVTSLFNDRPVLLIAGSVTCPMTSGSMADMRELHTLFGNEVDFVLLYVREAHPGDLIVQPDSLSGKIANAARLSREMEIPGRLVIDGVDGQLHRSLGGLPNSVHLFDAGGTQRFRALWAGDVASVRQALGDLTETGTVRAPESERKLRPITQGLGVMRETLAKAGTVAQDDVRREVPPMSMIAGLASIFRPFSPLGRGRAALATGGIAVAGIGAALFYSARALLRGAR